jgi:hypothetical protein
MSSTLFGIFGMSSWSSQVNISVEKTHIIMQSKPFDLGFGALGAVENMKTNGPERFVIAVDKIGIHGNT